MTHLSVGVGEDDAEVGHGPEDGDEGLDGVGVDYGPVLLEVLAGEAALVDDLHLLDNCTLTRLSRPCNNPQ